MPYALIDDAQHTRTTVQVHVITLRTFQRRTERRTRTCHDDYVYLHLLVHTCERANVRTDCVISCLPTDNNGPYVYVQAN